MRLSNFVPLALATCLAACGGDPGTMTGSLPEPNDDDTPSPSAGKDAGGKDFGRTSGSSPSSSSSSSIGGGSSGSKPTLDPVDEGPAACDKLQLQGAPNAPDILIVLDRSGSMVGLGDMRNMGKNRWEPSKSAVKKLTSSLTDTVSFGLMLFPAPGNPFAAGANGVPGCAPGMINVPVELNTAAKIASALDMSTPDIGATPTTTSLQAARSALAANQTCGDCRPVPKYILLVTDGQPTCGTGGGGVTLPEDIAMTTDAIDALTSDGVKTYVIGYDTASDPAAATAMDEFAKHGGTEKHYPVEDEATLVAELTRIAGALVPCEFELSMDIPDPTYVRVEIDHVTYNYMTDWTIDGRKVVLDPKGGACPKLRDAKLHDLKITRECEVIPVQ